MRRLADLYAILLVVWSSMMLGLYVIFGVVLPAELPLDMAASPGLLGTLKVALGAALGLLWLKLWRRLTYWSFRRAVKMRASDS